MFVAEPWLDAHAGSLDISLSRGFCDNMLR
jgi:hypothetical protein